MLQEAVTHLKGPTTIEKIYFVLYDAKALAVFERVMSEMKERGELAGGVAPAGSP
jgi:O-acetyl-ADP-ribose deacetylase (regulator of RNase III)